MSSTASESFFPLIPPFSSTYVVVIFSRLLLSKCHFFSIELLNVIKETFFPKHWLKLKYVKIYEGFFFVFFLSSLDINTLKNVLFQQFLHLFDISYVNTEKGAILSEAKSWEST